MVCLNCGNEVSEGAQFCENCGAKLEVSVGRSGNIMLCSDGKYRWYYEYPMLKNPTILFTVWKVLLIAGLVPALISFFAGLSDGFLNSLKVTAEVFVLVSGIFLVLSIIGYLILAASYGWKYVVLFEMDDEQITHSQQDKQFKKAQAIGWLAGFAGLASGNFTAAGSGFLAASKQSSKSVFKNVDTVTGLRKRNTIKVNQLLSKNQVYVYDEDYDFVWEYITSRCKKAKINK